MSDLASSTPNTTVHAGSEIDVILPCLDEALALPWVLSRMPAGFRPVVADNGSTDGSAALARHLGAHVVDVPRRGFGAAVHAGLQACTSELVAVMDADASLDPADLPRLVAPVAAGQFDLVMGRRRPVTRTAWPPHARIANAVVTHRLRRRTRFAVRDIGPMRVARRADWMALDITDRRFGYPLEMLVLAAAAGWSVAELDVGYRDRAAGSRSKVTGTLRGTICTVRDMSRVLAR